MPGASVDAHRARHQPRTPLTTIRTAEMTAIASRTFATRSSPYIETSVSTPEPVMHVRQYAPTETAQPGDHFSKAGRSPIEQA